MSLASAADVPLLITSANSSSERRISPSWSIAYFKARLEPITGISAAAQQLVLRLRGSQQEPLPIEAADEESTILAAWPLVAYSEIYVCGNRSFDHPAVTFSALCDVEHFNVNRPCCLRGKS